MIGSILCKKGTHSNLEMNKEWIEKREKDRLKLERERILVTNT
jgi:hypothetical protein